MKTEPTDNLRQTKKTLAEPIGPSLANGLRVHIAALGVGCCSCGVKSPDPQWHDRGCRVWNVAHALDNVDALEGLVLSAEARLREIIAGE